MWSNVMKSAILAICLGMSMALHSRGKLPLLGNHKLMDFMVQSRDVTARNPERSLSCFDYYVPILNDITSEYETSYAACIQTGDEARENVDASMAAQRDQIEDSASDACYALKSCTTYNSSIPYFECFVNVGGDNSKTMYGISTNASEALVNVREQYRLIDNDQYRCTNASERAYVQNTADTYEELHNCLLGLSSVPTPQPTNPSTDTTISTTEQPGTTETSPEPETTTMTTESDTTAASDVRNSRLAIKDSKWQHVLGKLGRHAH